MLTNSNELLGRALGTCTLKRLIGRGGMGAVYLAQQSRPRRTVAVKVLLPHLVEIGPREEFLARFRREADAIAALDHINIMPIYEYGEQGEAAYLVMPYVTGGTLRERLQVQPILPIQDVVAIIEQVATGLDSAHALGIIHRDLKPGNILFHSDGRILITDFGLAKMLKDVQERDSAAHALTSAGSIIGTPEYLSPEQGTGNPTDYHTDVYSLGVVLYQMLAGRVPFTGATPVAVAIKHALQEPPLITQFNPAIPHSVQAVVMKALAKAPGQRFASAGELARALRLAISNESATTIWQGPDISIPSVTTIPTPDSSHSGENTAPHATPKGDFKASENETIAIIEETGDSRKNVAKDIALEATSLDQTPPGMTQEKVAHQSTVVMGPQEDKFHDAPTREEHLTGMQDEASTANPPRGMQEGQVERKAFQQEVEMPMLSPRTQQPQYSPALANDRPEKRVQQEPVVLRTTATPLQRTRRRFQPVWMIVIGGLLSLVLISGAFAAYQRLQPTRSGSAAQNSGATSTAIGTPSSQGTAPSSQNPTPQATPPPLAAISPAISAGGLLYGAPRPFSACDKQGGHWTDTANALVICNADGSAMTNRSGHFAVNNLDQLAGNRSPWPSQNFIVQVQVSINADSHGTFGINFPSQAGNDTQGSFAYLLDRSGNWSFNHYDTQGNVMSTLVTGKLLSSISTKLTIDIRVQGTNYAFYVNGVDTTGRATTGSQFRDKTAGLAVDANANVTFSDFAIYALP